MALQAQALALPLLLAAAPGLGWVGGSLGRGGAGTWQSSLQCAAHPHSSTFQLHCRTQCLMGPFPRVLPKRGPIPPNWIKWCSWMVLPQCLRQLSTASTPPVQHNSSPSHLHEVVLLGVLAAALQALGPGLVGLPPRAPLVHRHHLVAVAHLWQQEQQGWRLGEGGRGAWSC